MAKGPALKYSIARELGGRVVELAGILSRVDPDIETVRGPNTGANGQLSFTIHIQTKDEGLRSFAISVKELN